MLIVTVALKAHFHRGSLWPQLHTVSCCRQLIGSRRLARHAAVRTVGAFAAGLSFLSQLNIIVLLGIASFVYI